MLSFQVVAHQYEPPELFTGHHGRVACQGLEGVENNEFLLPNGALGGTGQ